MSEPDERNDSTDYRECVNRMLSGNENLTYEEALELCRKEAEEDREKDETMSKALAMSELVQKLRRYGYSRVEAEKRSEELLDEFLAKRRIIEDSAKKKKEEIRKKTDTQEIFEELMRQKNWSRRG